MNGQISILEEIIVDNFAGGGGASTGMELATGRPVTIAINHDPAAILMHKTNHPYTHHLQASVWDVDPVEVCAGRPVGLAWFSPDCKHFSKAKGAALVDRNIRGLAWIVLRWAGTVRPRVIILENVEEFTTWGPVRKGKPVRSRAGETFRQWKRQLAALGYEIDHRELVAANYGAPTTRRRFVLVARCDGRPIVWPKPTHSRDGAGGLKRWRSAAEIVDWTVPMYSIFATRQEIKDRYGVNVVRPLADNTLQRVIRGVDKFTIRSGKPFLIQAKFKNQAQDIDRPLTTVTAVGAHELIEPILAPITFPNTANSIGAPANEPVHTITSAGNQILSVANLIQYHTEQTENVRANGLGEPLPTVDASNRYGLVAANLVEYYGNGNPLSLREPIRTVTSHDREALTAAHVVEFKGQDMGQNVDRPLRTITASAGEFAVAGVTVRKFARDINVLHWPEIRALLNRYCGYHLAEDEIILLEIRGRLWFMADITLRMLIPAELYRAMGFPADYIIDRDYTGRPYPKTQQVARCGNAVCPQMAAAVVRANLPEWAVELESMEDLRGTVAM